MALDQTVKGGAYKDASGNWFNGKGEKIAAPDPAKLPRLETEEVATPDEVTPGAGLLRRTGASEYAAPVDDVDEEEEKATRKVSRKKS